VNGFIIHLFYIIYEIFLKCIERKHAVEQVEEMVEFLSTF